MASKRMNGEGSIYRRNTAASLMLTNGIPLQVVSDILGHASIRITGDVYGHALAPQRQEAADVMAMFYAA
jgi:integrase